MATLEGATHIVRYVNRAFCHLLNESAAHLVGKRFHELLPEKDECTAVVERVFRTGKPETHTEQKYSESHPFFWSYTVWPVMAAEETVGVVVLVTETTQTHETTLAINEALVIGVGPPA